MFLVRKLCISCIGYYMSTSSKTGTYKSRNSETLSVVEETKIDLGKLKETSHEEVNNEIIVNPAVAEMAVTASHKDTEDKGDITPVAIEIDVQKGIVEYKANDTSEVIANPTIAVDNVDTSIKEEDGKIVSTHDTDEYNEKSSEDVVEVKGDESSHTEVTTNLTAGDNHQEEVCNPETTTHIPKSDGVSNEDVIENLHEEMESGKENGFKDGTTDDSGRNEGQDSGDNEDKGTRL